MVSIAERFISTRPSMVRAVAPCMMRFSMATMRAMPGLSS